MVFNKQLKKIKFSTVLTIFEFCFLYLLKTVEIVIIQQKQGGNPKKMRQQVLKALANPARIFYVPYTLAVMNFAVQFIVFIAIFSIDLVVNGADTKVSPLYFLISVAIVHAILAFFSKRDPQLGQIISAKIQLFIKKIPRKLAA